MANFRYNQKSLNEFSIFDLMLPKKLQKRLNERKENHSLRSLGTNLSLIDFSSNDYLGFSSSEEIRQRANEILTQNNLTENGATGSRLLSGNHQLYPENEKYIANFHNSESALIFNSGYDANIGFFGSVPQRGDLIFYDELIHASIRDGISMSKAKAYKFKHNDLNDLKQKCRAIQDKFPVENEIYIVTESVFSMDGDSPDIKHLSTFCTENNYNLIVDEAHSVGVIGEGKGTVQELDLENEVFARIVTFGKALGCHGAVILGSEDLKSYLVNFARSLIYSTALPPHSVATILAAYEQLEQGENSKELQQKIKIFKSIIDKYNLQGYFTESNSAIQCCIIPDAKKVKQISEKLKEEGFDVKPILSPTVEAGKERLRFCIHIFNTEEQMNKALEILSAKLGVQDIR